MIDFELVIAVVSLLVECISLSLQIASFMKESVNDRQSDKLRNR